MYPRTEYEMTDGDLEMLMNASRSTPVMMIGGYDSSGPQENANRAWAALGLKMGFDSNTVRPVAHKGNRFFTAIPSEPEDQRQTRLAAEANTKRLQDIERLKGEIAERERQIASLSKGDR